jgi:hypothetical protein
MTTTPIAERTSEFNLNKSGDGIMGCPVADSMSFLPTQEPIQVFPIRSNGYIFANC